MNKILLILSLNGMLFFLQGCNTSAFELKLNGNYYLTAFDVKSNMEIVYKDENDNMFSVVKATVFAVGQDEGFIVAKQHPRSFPDKEKRDIVKYYIIPLTAKLKKSNEDNFIGPLTAEEFSRKKNEFNIDNIEFTIIFKDLE